MEIKNLHRPFEVEFLELTSYPVREHKNTFFEMVFILDGKGIQSINNHKLAYSANKLFLIFPQDSHGFEIHSPTSFFFIRFNESYLKGLGKEWVQKLEFMFHSHNHLPGCILNNISDKPLIRALAEALIREQQSPQVHQEEVIRQIINTVITVAARNLSIDTRSSVKRDQTNFPIHLLNYIHQHIYFPDQLKAEKIADHFHISPTYISEYFRSKTGESLQQYISGYRLKLIETRLRFTDMQINEIVFEFGFTDASHLNRIFKKHKGLNPSTYKKMHHYSYSRTS